MAKTFVVCRAAYNEHWCWKIGRAMPGSLLTVRLFIKCLSADTTTECIRDFLCLHPTNTQGVNDKVGAISGRNLTYITLREWWNSKCIVYWLVFFTFRFVFTFIHTLYRMKKQKRATTVLGVCVKKTTAEISTLNKLPDSIWYWVNKKLDERMEVLEERDDVSIARKIPKR